MSPSQSHKSTKSPPSSDFQNLYIGQRLDVLGIKAATVNTGNTSSAIARGSLVVTACVRKMCLLYTSTLHVMVHAKVI
jgi:hypothetical protein